MGSKIRYSCIMGEENALTVSQLTGLIKTMLENSFRQIFLVGEISNYRPNISGHLYFQLKDSNSQISAVMFRGNASHLAFVPKDGMLVQVKGQISVYAQRGNYQIIISSMTPAGTGGIMEMIEERKKRLAQEGLFDSSRKRKLPPYPKTVGIVTSPTGAALRDIINITRHRNDGMNLIVLPALVQGEDAAKTIVAQIKAANHWHLCDVLIVGRGGGSLEDLLPFSDEEVVREIASSKIPVVSAVGHEIDWALSDYAADVRASTPSHAAEIVVPQKQQLLEQIRYSASELYSTINSRTQNLRLMLKTFTPENMELQFRSIEQPLLSRYENAVQELTSGIQKKTEDTRLFLQRCTEILESASPQSIFNRGYSMVTDAETGKVIRSMNDTRSGARIVIRPAKGRIEATVVKGEQA